MGNSEIEKICRSIYKKHQNALDLIFQYKPDIVLEISEYLQKLLKVDGIIVEAAGKTIIRFTTKNIDSLIEKRGEGWSKSKRSLLFEFDIYDYRLVLNLYVGPGEKEYRDKLLQFFKDNKDLFKLAGRKNIGTKWHAVYQKKFLKKNDYIDATIEDLKTIIDPKWKEFYEKDLKIISSYLMDNWKE